MRTSGLEETAQSGFRSLAMEAISSTANHTKSFGTLEWETSIYPGIATLEEGSSPGTISFIGSSKTIQMKTETHSSMDLPSMETTNSTKWEE